MNDVLYKLEFFTHRLSFLGNINNSAGAFSFGAEDTYSSGVSGPYHKGFIMFVSCCIVLPVFVSLFLDYFSNQQIAFT